MKMETFEPIVKTYYDALEEGRTLARRCRRCGAINYPPMPICQECSSTDTEWVEFAGEGTLVALGSLEDKFMWPQMKDYLPLRWGEVHLDGGPAITAVVLGVEDEEAVQARLPVPVRMEIIQDDGFKTVAFRVVE